MSATPAEIARRALADHLAALPAAELLSRSAKRRDPEAFAGLVRQFGPLVIVAYSVPPLTRTMRSRRCF